LNAIESKMPEATPAAPDADDDADLAPRPRPGWRSRRDERQRGGAERTHLFAAVLRAGAGVAGLFAALLYLPIQNVTPVLAGVSILMMVTGNTGAWRAVREIPALKRLPLVLTGGCAVATVAVVVLTLVFGAGSFGPLRDLKHRQHAAAAPTDDDGAATVHFEPAP
jgi:hypothetical protein